MSGRVLKRLPTKPKYDVVLADPPWRFSDKAAAGKRGAAFKYSVMGLGDIMSVGVELLTMPDATLFLWVPASMLQEGMSVVALWGFRYKTIGFVWAKQSKTGEKWAFGMGHWTRQNAEVCLLGIKGEPKRANASVRQLVVAPIRRHSQKPDDVCERVRTLCGEDKRYIELFARTRSKGWDAWGEECR